MKRSAIVMVLAVSAGALAQLAATGCGVDDESKGSNTTPSCEGFGCQDGGFNECVGLQCQQVKCEGSVSTTLTGRVFDPAGRLPLYNVTVYVPNGELKPIETGLGESCDRCAGSVTGNPIAITQTNESGDFKLENVPANTDFPLVIQVGKWRREIPIPRIEACTQAAADPLMTRLPKDHTQGNIPHIALSTGSADALECLLRKVGIEASEFGTKGSDARIHLYRGESTAPSTATSSFKNGPAFAASTDLWKDEASLSEYDIVMMACEGDEYAAKKTTASRQALYDYAARGGRVFTSHFHHYWFSNSPVESVRNLATWVNDGTCQGGACVFEPEPPPTDTVNATVNTAFEKGAAMKAWLKNTNSLTGPGETLPIVEMRHNVSAVTSNALSWMTVKNPKAGDRTAHEYVSFNTPVGATDAEVCGRVVYSDLHVGGGAGDATGVAFPDGCSSGELTPQQKALVFMLFDLSSCVQRDELPLAAK